MYLAANKDDEPNAPFAEQHKRINELFQTEQHSWLDAYEIEQLLSFVITDEQLAAELPRRMAEAKALNLQYVTAMEERFKAIVEDEAKAEEDADREKCQDAKRYLMQRALNDLQWFYKQRIRRRDAAKRLALRVSAMFLSAFFFFSTLLFIQYLSIPKNENGDPQQGQSSEETKPPAGARKEAK